MRLKFEGQAAVEARYGGVNFAGYYEDGTGRRNDVLCRISRKALELLCALSNPTADDLLSAYQRESERINQLAAAQFGAGINSPSISVEDIPSDRATDSQVA